MMEFHTQPLGQVSDSMLSLCTLIGNDVTKINKLRFIYTVQQHESPTTATAVQLSQECSNEALFQLSTEIAGYHKYKHRLGLTSADIYEIDNDPRNFYSVQGKFYTALLKWKSISIDFDNPSNSTATYGRLVEIAATFKDGEAIRGIHKASVKHASEIPLYSQEYIERVSNVGILMYAESNVTSCICHGLGMCTLVSVM